MEHSTVSKPVPWGSGVVLIRSIWPARSRRSRCQYSRVPKSGVFLNTWQRGEYWGLLVLPPNRLPNTVEEGDWLEAVAGLEKTEQWRGAAIGYATALKRWPQSFGASMGLGNSRYSLHDLAGAAEAFRRATLLEPKNGIPFNNLAQVLNKQGKRKEALAAAQRAVELGGPLLENFKQTLEMIKTMPAPKNARKRKLI